MGNAKATIPYPVSFSLLSFAFKKEIAVFKKYDIKKSAYIKLI